MLTDVERLKDREAKKRVPGGWFSDKQKLEAVQMWLITGSMPATAAALNINVSTIEKWRYTDWWKELSDQIKAEGRVKLSGRLQKIVGRTLDQLEDRIENGDFILDSKTGQIVRKPLMARDLTRITTDFMASSQKLESVTKEEATVQAIEDRLKLIAENFASFAKKVRKVEVEDLTHVEQLSVLGTEAEVIEGGTPPYREEPGDTDPQDLLDGSGEEDLVLRPAETEESPTVLLPQVPVQG